ncbi:hypothetical protein Cdeb_01683 [Caldibacillus debilis GB1]|uniref:Uncharacterized protein n=1 Tax=Caldibacillus debilis GB1 TaxID=1339248 RepID=A0A420VCK7_9BACI|nr:hypothetical protein Cdeb_01683 [Caldibacillus debilis GB1]
MPHEYNVNAQCVKRGNEVPAQPDDVPVLRMVGRAVNRMMENNEFPFGLLIFFQCFFHERDVFSHIPYRSLAFAVLFVRIQNHKQGVPVGKPIVSTG